MSKIDEIKERHRLINMKMTAPGIEDYRADVEYLLSRLEIAEKALTEFTDKHFHGGSKANREDYTIFNVTTADVYKLREALQQIRE